MNAIPSTRSPRCSISIPPLQTKGINILVQEASFTGCAGLECMYPKGAKAMIPPEKASGNSREHQETGFGGSKAGHQQGRTDQMINDVIIPQKEDQ